LLAFGIDYVLIAVYLLLLATASLLALATPVGPVYKSIWSNSWSAELTGFLVLTAPVIPLLRRLRVLARRRYSREALAASESAWR
jgi:hypothetical protein